MPSKRGRIAYNYTPLNAQNLCSGDMLLEALVAMASAGVTLEAVATTLDIDLRSGTVTAERDLDFRETLLKLMERY